MIARFAIEFWDVRRILSGYSSWVDGLYEGHYAAFKVGLDARFDVMLLYLIGR